MKRWNISSNLTRHLLWAVMMIGAISYLGLKYRQHYWYQWSWGTGIPGTLGFLTKSLVVGFYKSELFPLLVSLHRYRCDDRASVVLQNSWPFGAAAQFGISSWSLPYYSDLTLSSQSIIGADGPPINLHSITWSTVCRLTHIWLLFHYRQCTIKNDCSSVFKHEHTCFRRI